MMNVPLTVLRRLGSIKFTFVAVLIAAPAFSQNDDRLLPDIDFELETRMAESYQKFSQEVIDELTRQGFREYTNLDLHNIEYQDVRFVITDYSADNLKTREFLRTLESEKENLMALYGLKNYQYNELARLAIGILGQESDFFKSIKYKIKEALPGGVRIAKIAKEIRETGLGGIKDTASEVLSEDCCAEGAGFYQNRIAPFITEFNPGKSSRGPTQIKDIPPEIFDLYGVTPRTLSDPRNAAVATIGFLAHTAEQLRSWANTGLECINDSNFYEMSLYIYFGRQCLVSRCERGVQSEISVCKVEEEKVPFLDIATPDENRYVQNHRIHRSKVRIFETPPGSQN